MNDKLDISKLNKYVKEFGLTFTECQLNQFLEYYELLVEWNSFMNLTAITEFEEVLVKHFTDSISLIQAKDIDLIKEACIEGKSISVLDIGTGAGFPSIPLKIAFPNLKITMLDSLNKRIKFLGEVITRLDLKDICAIHGRAEDFAIAPSTNSKKGGDDKKEYLRESFDLVVSRAVANLSTLSEYCLPYVKENGLFVSYKSEELEKEKETAKKAVDILGGRIENTVSFYLPETDMYRSLCVIRKIKSTPKKYPRKAGLPSKEPIV